MQIHRSQQISAPVSGIDDEPKPSRSSMAGFPPDSKKPPAMKPEALVETISSDNSYA
jgi:hypothetical protein